MTLGDDKSHMSGSKGISEPFKVWLKNYFYLTYRSQKVSGDVYFWQKSVALKACLKGFAQNIIENYKTLVRIKKIKVWTTKIGACL